MLHEAQAAGDASTKHRERDQPDECENPPLHTGIIEVSHGYTLRPQAVSFTTSRPQASDPICTP